MPTLTSLPSDAACAVSAMLNARDLLRLALASKFLVDSPFHFVCFRRVLLLFVPPDASHQAWFRQPSFDSLDFTIERLDHLEFDQADSDVLPTFLRQLRPLKTLCLDRVCPPDIPAELATAIEQTHSNTLESLTFHELSLYQHCELHPTPALRDLSIASVNVVGGLEAVSSLVNLRSLDIHPGWITGCLYTPLEDLTPLSSLVNLEVLKVAVSRDAVTCTPLRRLTKLRELTVENAWLRDFIAYLPRLVSLQCHEDEYKPLDRSFTFRTDERQGFRPEKSIVRAASVGPTVKLNVYAFALLANVRSLTVDTRQQPTHYLRKISKLKWVTMVRFSYSGIDPMETQRTRKLACVARIERLEFWITHPFSEQRFCPWNLAGAVCLRVLIISWASQSVLNAITRWRHSLISLQELYLEHFQGNSIQPLLLLSQLQAVQIGNKFDCTVLREAARPEQALPLLTRVIHSDAQWNCLCTRDVCRYGNYGAMHGRV